MTLANAHALFVGLQKNPSYLASLEIEDNERQRLLNARQTIRTALRNATHRLESDKSFWRRDYLIETANRIQDDVKVKFMTQGSFAYKTLNAPAQPALQEIDLDDGMYVPVRFLSDNHPALAAGALFTFVEEVLRPVCRANGWSLDSSKDTCVRIKLWRGAHIDIPIYSVPEERFRVMKAAIEEAAFSARKLTFDSVPAIPSDRVMLAQRSGEWVQSDPKQLHDWVENRVDRHGPSFRRMSRFFKGWRDHVWANSPLSSICLMCAIDAALLELGQSADNRDDKTILDLARLLPTIFSGEIKNPVVKASCLNSWSEEERGDVLAETRALAATMEAALERTGDADRVIEHLRDAFGRRIPYRPDIIAIESDTAAAVRAAPAATVATPHITSSDSG
ncbi:hypothetical protein MACH24_08400 [Erythrobacter sp. Dej080120_24]|uniref:CBASS cGAMP synthase n=1 Tax=Erythrobacter TaxID=1041 RepID=UPI002079E40D|nr:hypothetical protein [Erythrobacter aurantius]BDW81402.1 hypothetical protein MACH24_08400 [Erythrobacter sp. Dej080120_24]